MNNSNLQIQQPLIAIDRKQNRIRIHRGSLHLLGDPEYIQFLVHPIQRNIILIPSIKSDHLAHRIRWDRLNKQKDCVFYSKDLTKEISKLATSWDYDSTYSLIGHYISGNNAILFPIKESYKVDTELSND